MDNSLHFAGYDFVILGLLFLFTVRGLWVGFLRQITTLVALVVGYVIASQYHDKLFPFLREVTDNPQAVFWISYVILFFLTYIVTMLAGKALSRVVEMTIAGWFDKLLGGVLGLVKAGVLIVLMNMVLTGVFSPENTMLRGCYFCPYVKQATEIFRSLIKDDTMRKAFAQKVPAISESVSKVLVDDGVRPFISADSPAPEDTSPSVE